MKSNKILLVYAGQFGSIFPEIPIALLYIAWALRKVKYDVEILDMRIKKFREIDPSVYLFAGISSMTGPMLREGLKFAQFFRERNPKVPIVWGGIHVSLLPEQSLQNPFVDIVVRGEGELTVQELANAIRDEGDMSVIKGISYKKDGKIFSNPDRGFMDLNTVDIELPYDLFDLKKYSLEEFPLHTSRGCPYRCGFCYNVSYNKRSWRHKTTQRVLDELDWGVKKFGFKKLNLITEDEFFIDIKRVREIAEGIVARGYQLEWGAFCRFNSFKMVDDQMLELIQKAGCGTLSFGGESGSQRMLDEIIQKDIKVNDMIETTRRLSKSNIKQIVSFMSGLPTETEDDMNQTFQLMDTLKGLNPNLYLNGIYLYTPFPGTPLFDRVVKDYNYQYPQTMEAWSDFNIFRDVGNNWNPKKYIRKYRIVSILTRFPFWKDKFTFEDMKKVVGSSRLSRFPWNLFYWLFSNLAILRWKKKFFKFPVEFILLEKALTLMRGFV